MREVNKGCNKCGHKWKEILLPLDLNFCPKCGSNRTWMKSS